MSSFTSTLTTTFQAARMSASGMRSPASRFVRGTATVAPTFPTPPPCQPRKGTEASLTDRSTSRQTKTISRFGHLTAIRRSDPKVSWVVPAVCYIATDTHCS